MNTDEKVILWRFQCVIIACYTITVEYDENIRIHFPITLKFESVSLSNHKQAHRHTLRISDA